MSRFPHRVVRLDLELVAAKVTVGGSMSALVQHVGVSVLHTPGLVTMGATAMVYGTWYIFLRAGLGSADSRSALLHELAHNALRRAGRDDWADEEASDYLAAALERRLTRRASAPCLGRVE